MQALGQLITRADDFGASPGANAAIIAALRAGFLRNAGVLVPGTFVHHRLEELAELSKGTCLGLHACINSEWERPRWKPLLPPSQIPSLIESDGTFLKTPRETHRHGRLEEIVAEISAQLRHLRALGIDPAYLDCHMVFTWLEGVTDALADLCAREGMIYAHSSTFVQRSWAARAALPELASKGSRMPVVFAHPAFRDEVSEGFGEACCRERADEAALFTDVSRTAQLCAQEGIEPLRYTDVMST